MAEETSKFILDVEINGLNTLKELEEALKQSKAAQKDFIIGSEEYKRAEANIGALTNRQKALREEQQRVTAAQKAGTNTIEGMRRKLTDLNKQWKNAEIGSEAFNALTVEIKQTTEQLKKFESAAGDNRRNVGNYTSSIREAIVQNTGFGRSLGALSQGLKANPFTILVVSLVGLANALKNNNEIFDAFERGLNALGTTMNVILNRIISLGTAFKELFSGNFQEAARAAARSFSGIAKEISEQVKVTDDATVAQQELDDALRAFNVTSSEQEMIIARLLRQAKNRTLSDEERIKLIERALDVERQRLNEEITLADRQIAIEEARVASAVNKEKVDIALGDARIKRNNLLTASIKLQERAENELDALREAAAEKERKRFEAARESYEKQQTELNLLRQAQGEFEQKQREEQLEELNLLRQAQGEFEQKQREEQLDKFRAAEDAYNERLQAQREMRISAEADMYNSLLTLGAAFAGQNAEAQKAFGLFVTNLEFFTELARINSNAAVNADITQTTRALLTASAIARYVANIANISGLTSPEGFATGGQVGHGGMKVSRSNGDNRLITAKVGEVILNKYQRSVIGEQALRKAGVPGFARGGLVSTASGNNAAQTAQLTSISRNLTQRQPPAEVKVTDIRDTQARVSVSDRRSRL